MISKEGMRSSFKIERKKTNEDIVIDNEKYNVLAGVSDVTCPSRDLPLELIKAQLKGFRIGVNGEPSSGKTAFLIQLSACAAENAQKLGIAYAPRIGQYDFQLALEKGIRKPDDGKGNLEGSDFNKHLYDAFKDTTSFEMPGVGRKDVKDRGRSAFEKIASDIGSERDNKTILVSFPCNRLLQIRGGLLRSFIVNIPSENIDSIYDVLEKHKMNIVGIPKTKEVAQIIQDLFKKMGQEEHIKQIRDEENDLYYAWEELQSPDVFEKKSSQIYFPDEDKTEVLSLLFKDFGIEITDDVKKIIDVRSKAAMQDSIRQAIKMEDEYRNTFMIPKEKGIVAANAFSNQPVTLDFSSLIKNS